MIICKNIRFNLRNIIHKNPHLFVKKLDIKHLLQLGAGQNYNVTLNLSGIILMGLGLSTALLAYMFLNSFKDDGGSSYSTGSGYGSYGHDTSGSGYEYRRGDKGRKGSKGKVMMILDYLTI
jgi:hypothetical protein